MPELSPWIPLSVVASSEASVLCVPGAGASVTSFLELCQTLGGSYSLFGLQPRGLDGAHSPYASVEEEASANVRVARTNCPPGPVHLLGHSRGGAVAFEMARQLQRIGETVASVTMIDSLEYNRAADEGLPLASGAFKGFARALSSAFDVELPVKAATLEMRDPDLFLKELHAEMLLRGRLGPRTKPEMLRGSLAVYMAAMHEAYVPSTLYPIRAHLALACDRSAYDQTTAEDEVAAIRFWRSHVAELEVWKGPGDHFSILRSPNVQVLADWWRHSVARNPPRRNRGAL